MPRPILAIAADHAGYALKTQLVHILTEQGYNVQDLGTDSEDSVDYPDYAHTLAEWVHTHPKALGVLICGSGIGMSMAANRHTHIRAALCNQGIDAALARQHNDANVLVLGARLIGEAVARDCVERFLQTDFEAGRHTRRVTKITPGA